MRKAWNGRGEESILGGALVPIIFVVIILIAVPIVFTLLNSTVQSMPGQVNTMEQSSGYVIYESIAGLACAKNGATNVIDSTGSNFSKVMQYAIDHTDGIIAIKAGDYRQPYPIILDSGTNIIGSGSGTNIRLSDASDCLGLYAAPGLTNISISSLCYDGNGYAQTFNASGQWAFYDNQNIRISNVDFKDLIGTAISFGGDPNETHQYPNVVSQCNFRVCGIGVQGAGVYTQAQYCLVLNCYFENTQDNAIGFDGASYSLASGNIAKDCGFLVGIGSIVPYHFIGHDITVTGNMAVNCDRGVLVYSYKGDVNNLTITDNIIQGASTGHGIEVRSGINHIIAGNKVSSALGWGMYLALNESQISNNQAFDNAAGGLYLFHCENSSVMGNQAYDNGWLYPNYSAGILLQYAANCSITGNDCYNLKGTDQAQGLELDNSNHVAVVSNVLHLNRVYQFTHVGSYAMTISSNIGYLTEASGRVNISAGSVSIIIHGHGLGEAPTYVALCESPHPGQTEFPSWGFTADATDIAIYSSNLTTDYHWVYWHAGVII
jgi:parallel beta-helix repeat protein